MVNKKISDCLWMHTCERRGCVWTSKNEFPMHCSICNSPYWNKKKEKKNNG